MELAPHSIKSQTAGMFLRTVLATVSLLHTVGTVAEEKVTRDPVQLLRNVETARLKVSSGQLVIRVTGTPTAPPKHGTDRYTLKVVFDGEKRRFEGTRRELVIDGSGPDGGRARDQKLNELGGDREAFVRLGLGQWQESYYCTAYDGNRLLRYGNHMAGADIDNPAHGSWQYASDPRTLGLDTAPTVTATVASCLGYSNAKAVAVVGSKKSEKAPTWHVLVVTKWGDELHIWIDRECPTQIVRFERISPDGKRRDVAVSQYADRQPENPLPQLVETEQYWNGTLTRRGSFEVQVAHYNVPTDPTSWALAGLNMPIGTPVADVRIRRRIGYWDGRGLSENLPAGIKSLRPLEAPPDAGKLLDVARKDPKSALARDAVCWIIVNTPEGPDVKEAGDILIREHIENKDLGVFCQRLEDRSSETVLRVLNAILKRNPHRLPLAYSNFALARHAKEMLSDPDLTDAERASLDHTAHDLFSRVIANYADVVDQRWGRLGDVAKRELHELDKLEIGMVAPEIEGRDADGKAFKLTDYRGRLVLLCFSASWCGPCVAMYAQKRALLELYSAKPFTVLDVNADDAVESLRDSVKKGKITWRCWWEGASRDISQRWNVQGWPTVYLIDSKGIIRGKNIRGNKLDEAIKRLLIDAAPLGTKASQPRRAGLRILQPSRRRDGHPPRSGTP